MCYLWVKLMGTYLRAVLSHGQCFYCTEQLKQFLGLLHACYYFLSALVIR